MVSGPVITETSSVDELADVRRWHLSAFNAAKDLIHDETCVGETALNAALLEVESRPDYHRHTVRTEPRGNRQTFRAPLPLPPPKPDPGRFCTECELPELECRKRARVNGHDFAPNQPDAIEPIVAESSTLQGELA